MFGVLSEFLTIVTDFFLLIFTIPEKIVYLFGFISQFISMLLGDGIGDIVVGLFIALVSFILIYFIVKLVLSFL